MWPMGGGVMLEVGFPAKTPAFSQLLPAVSPQFPTTMPATGFRHGLLNSLEHSPDKLFLL